MRYIFPLLLTLMLSDNAFAKKADQADIVRIEKIVDNNQLLLHSTTQALQRNDTFILFSHSSGNPIGYVQVTDPQKNNRALARFFMQNIQTTVLPQDRLQKLDLQKGSPDFKGQTSFLIRQRADVPARYKPLVSLGSIEESAALAGSTAETLARGEHFIGVLGKYKFGLTNRLMFSTSILSNFAQIFNGFLKYRFYRSENFVMAFKSGGLITTRDIDGVKEFKTLFIGFNLDLISNDRFITHFEINGLITSVSLENLINSELRQVSSSFHSTTEIFLNNWHRILIGPRYFFDSKNVGGVVAMLFVFEHLHLKLGLGTRDVTELRFSTKNGYYPVFDLAWRL